MPKVYRRKSACSTCGVEKTTENTRMRVNYGSVVWEAYCNLCKAERLRGHRLRDTVGTLLAGARSRAKRTQVEFNLTRDDIQIPELCPVFGIPLWVQPGGRTDNSPTLDRIHPDRGYTKGNVAVVSWRANRLKNDATPDELRRLAEYTFNLL